jgi:protein-tyrosine-phosphatase
MRSYMCECVLRARAKEMLGDGGGVLVAESCGLAADVDRPPHPEAIRSLEKLAIPRSDSTATMADESTLDRADLALAMTRQQCYKMAGRFPAQAGKCYSLVEMNGAIEMLLEESGVTLFSEDWAALARDLSTDSLEAGLDAAVRSIKAIPREMVRQIPGVDMDIRRLMTDFAPCFYQASGIHDPLNGTRQDMDHCAELVDREVTSLVLGLLALVDSDKE